MIWTEKIRASVDALLAEIPAAPEPAKPVALFRDATAGILIEGVIGDDVTPAAVRDALAAAGDAPLLVTINSPGGNVFDGFAIMAQLERHPGYVTVRVEGLAASAASYIAMAADRVVMPEASMMMIHNASGMAIGTRDTMRATAETLERVDGLMASIYEARTNLPRERIEAMMTAETEMTAAEAVALGFADEIEATPRGAARRDGARRPEAAATTQAETLGITASVAPACPVTEKEDPRMSEETPQAVRQNDAPTAPVPATLDDLTAMARKARLDTDAENGFVLRQLRARATVDAARDALLETLAQKAEDAAIPPVRPMLPAAVTDGARDASMREAMVNGLMLRAGIVGADATVGRDFAGHSLIEMTRAFIEGQGGSTRGMSRDSIAATAVGLQGITAAGAGYHTTSDFPSILADVANKSLLAGYNSVPPTWQAAARIVSHNDFKEASYVRLGDMGVMPVVAEHGEYTRTTVGENAEKLRVEKRGYVFAITREAIINDDLSAFTLIPNRMGAAAGRTCETVFWNEFVTPKQLSDGQAFWSSQHGNLAGTATAVNTTGMSAAVKALRTQKGMGGTPIGIVPRTLIVAPDKEAEAKQLLASATFIASNVGTANIYANAFNLVVTPYLTGNAWYLIADPNQFDGFAMAFLNGQQEPYTEQRVGFDVDGMEFKIRLEFGCGALDWRAVYKNAGA